MVVVIDYFVGSWSQSKRLLGCALKRRADCISIYSHTNLPAPTWYSGVVLSTTLITATCIKQFDNEFDPMSATCFVRTSDCGCCEDVENDCDYYVQIGSEYCGTTSFQDGGFDTGLLLPWSEKSPSLRARQWVNLQSSSMTLTGCTQSLPCFETSLGWSQVHPRIFIFRIRSVIRKEKLRGFLWEKK